MKEGIEQPGRFINIRLLDENHRPCVSEVKADAIPEGVWRLLPVGDRGKHRDETVCALVR